MWFMESIISWLATARDWFYRAYSEVAAWVPPFNYLAPPLYGVYVVFFYLELYFGYFNEWLIEAADWISRILDVDAIYSAFRGFFDAAQDAWNWVLNAVNHILNVVNDWWSGVYYDVLALFHSAQDFAYNLYQGTLFMINEIRTQVQGIIDQIPDVDEILAWFGNWTGHVLSTITTWWNGAIGDVWVLIDSAFTMRDSLWAGWQDIRDQVLDFFTDPVEWIYSKLDEFFERFW